MHEDVDQARHAAARAKQDGKRAIADQRGTGISRHHQPMRHVGANLIALETMQPMLEDDPLAQLPHLARGELGVELGLAEQHHLEELALLGLEVGQQAQRLERVRAASLGSRPGKAPRACPAARCSSSARVSGAAADAGRCQRDRLQRRRKLIGEREQQRRGSRLGFGM